MAKLFDDVRPGDLITANFWNVVLHAIRSLDDRITALEAGTGGVQGNSVVITDMPLGPVLVNDPFTIKGLNFEFSIGATQVTFDNIPVDSFKTGSTDTVLNVRVPDVKPPQGGKWATVVVSNRKSSSPPRSVLVMPIPQPVFGGVQITPGILKPATPTEGMDADFAYTLVSGANLPATFDVIADVTGPPWQNLIQIFDSQMKLISDSQVPRHAQVPLTTDVPVSITVRIHPLPTGSTNTPFSLNVTASKDRASGTSGVQQYTVGVSPTPQDDTIGLDFSTSTPSGAVSGSTITCKTSVLITLSSSYSVAGKCDISLSAGSGAGTWSLQTTDPTPTNAGDPSKTTFTPTIGASGKDFKDLSFLITRQSGSKSGTITFTVQRQGNTLLKSKTFNLQLG